MEQPWKWHLLSHIAVIGDNALSETHFLEKVGRTELRPWNEHVVAGSPSVARSRLVVFYESRTLVEVNDMTRMVAVVAVVADCTVAVVDGGMSPVDSAAAAAAADETFLAVVDDEHIVVGPVVVDVNGETCL